MSLLLPLVMTAASLASTVPWDVIDERNICTLQTSAQQGGANLTIAFQPLFDSGIMELVVASDQGGPRANSLKKDARIRRVSDGKVFDPFYTASYISSSGLNITRLSLDSDVLFGSTNSTIRIEGEREPIIVDFSASGDAVTKLASCQNKVLTDWGVDISKLKDRKRAGTKNPAAYFGNDNYPDDAKRTGQAGRVVVALKVDSSGKVIDCRILVSAGKLLDDATCRQALLLPYKPAVDATGNPIMSVAILPVRWGVPG